MPKELKLLVTNRSAPYTDQCIYEYEKKKQNKIKLLLLLLIAMHISLQNPKVLVVDGVHAEMVEERLQCLGRAVDAHAIVDSELDELGIVGHDAERVAGYGALVGDVARKRAHEHVDKASVIVVVDVEVGRRCLCWCFGGGGGGGGVYFLIRIATSDVIGGGGGCVTARRGITQLAASC